MRPIQASSEFSLSTISIGVLASSFAFDFLVVLHLLKDFFPHRHPKVYSIVSSTDLKIGRGCGLKIEPTGKRVRFAQVFHRGPLQF
jgi:hypothetical protein